jgi:glycosyltransferase involved in cell wall biosynthesis
MKNLDIICSFYINSPIGPAMSLRRFIRDKNYLEERGYKLEVFSYDLLKTGENGKGFDFSPGLKSRNRLRTCIKKYWILSVLFNIRSLFIASKMIKKYESLRRNPDIVIFHSDINYCYQYLKQINSGAKKGLFIEIDGTTSELFLNSYPKLKNNFLLKIFIKNAIYVYEHCDKFVFVAQKVLDNFLLKNSSVEKRKTLFFPYGVDDKPIIASSDNNCFQYRLCCTGTICERKGQYIIIEALNLLDASIKKDIHLTLIGNGLDFENLKNKVKQYKLEENVIFKGTISNDKIHEELCKASIYILMSNNEGLPISIIEGMRAGLPIISTKIAGIPELVTPHYNGILIEPNVNELLSVLHNISNYDWKSMGMKSRERFEIEFTFEKMRKSYCDMLDDLSQS